MKSGILLIDKMEGISSAKAVARVKKVLKAKKAGHTGTLDPFATGLLVCVINKGTRISQFFLNGIKSYHARITLGIETDTYDLTGSPVFKAPENVMSQITKKAVETVIQSFAGVQDQVAPAYSALKYKGRPLYKFSRQGKKIQKPPRKIEIFDIGIKNIDLPYVDINIRCSAGTYIRSLAFDIGRKLSCGAHLSKLCRTGSSLFSLDQAMGLQAFERLEPSEAAQRIIPMAKALSFLPELKADAQGIDKIRFGQTLSSKDLSGAEKKGDKPYKVVDNQDRILAIVRWDNNRNAYNYSCVFLA